MCKISNLIKQTHAMKKQNPQPNINMLFETEVSAYCKDSSDIY